MNEIGIMTVAANVLKVDLSCKTTCGVNIKGTIYQILAMKYLIERIG
jgi:hypothetical protein